ncbi:MAG: hypothetical protein AAF297_11080 [Planctomycetota bacterium]
MPLTPDERDELAAVAASAERTNRPAALVVLAGLVFVIACGVLGVSATRQASAAAEVDRRSAEIERMRGLVIELEANLDEGSGPSLPLAGGMLTGIQAAARAAGIEADLAFNESSEEVERGIRLASVRYTLEHPSLEELMDWVDRVIDTVEGVTVGRVQIRPQERTKEWRFEIRFERYEQIP